MFAVATTRCSNTSYKVQFRVEWQSKYNFSWPLLIAEMWVFVVPTCSITNTTLTNISSPPWYSAVTVHWQPNVFELWLDTPIKCTQSTSFIRRPEINIQQHQLDSKQQGWTKKWKWIRSKVQTAELFVHTFCDYIRKVLIRTEYRFTDLQLHPAQHGNKMFTKDGQSWFTMAYDL